ncbi:MAG: DEAD/DEAH box helicase [Candidatus Aenigmarchaeota archaeon]|nr:DEAD/DEAH box helicase [Candidatus Aenigmarchaeota archaeon]
MEPVEIVKTRSKIKEFNPVQKLALESGLMEGNNLVVSSPTASGKTIIAELAIINNFIGKKGKSVYIVPLRALAHEKFEDFKEKYEEIGLKIGVSTGDLDSASGYLGGKDLIILTSEKLDSLIRHKITWLSEITLVVGDETHLLADTMRGPTFEIVMTWLKENLSPQILALSATISNCDEIAEWLNAELVLSDYRPIPLKKGIFMDKKLIFEDDVKDVECTDLNSVVKKVVEKGKQVLIFLSSRRNTESLAEKLSKEFPLVESKVSEKVLKVFETPTKQCRKLASCLRHGIAFHHAGLVNKQRGEIEKAFRGNEIKIICATTTLAAGLNMPAFLAIVRDVKRFSGGYSQYIPNLEVQQMLGRAGRPKYDKAGLGLLLAKDEKEANELRERYLLGGIEPIVSKLSMEPVLRMHLLSLVATGSVNSKEKLLNFFGKTFLGHTYGTSIELELKLEEILEQLEGFGFLNIEKFCATRIGKRVSELYLDPLSAHRILQSLEKAGENTSPLAYLQTLASCSELYPQLRVRNKESEDLEDFIAKNEKEFLVEVPDPWDYEHELFLNSVKTAKLLLDWISEKTEDVLLEKYLVTPGELYTKTSNCEWLVYAAQEFAKLQGNGVVSKELRKLQLRMKNGIKEELLELIMVKGIGRVKARRLFNSGIKGVSGMRENRILAERMVGKKTLEKILV